MFWFIAGLVSLLIGLYILITGPKGRLEDGYESNGYGREKKYKEVSLRGTCVIPLFIAAVFIILSSLTVVGTKNVGVVTVFGKPTGETLSAGLHVKAPWASVTDIDATVQVEEYSPSDPILVKIGDQGEAKIALAYRWRINPDGADKVYQDYRNSDDITKAVRKALVSTNIKAALNEELGDYNPLQNVIISDNMTPEQISKIVIPPIPYAALNEAVEKNLRAKITNLGDLIEVQSVTISYLQLPDSTQKKINEFNTKIQASKNALIDISIKQAQSTAFDKLSKSLQDDPNVLVSKCLDMLGDGDFQAPAGFSCWPGGGSAVVIPGSK